MLKKLLLFLGLILTPCLAYSASYERYDGTRKSTVCLASNSGTVLLSTRVVQLLYYQVLSTGTPGQTLEFYTGGHGSTATATQSWTGFPLTTFYDEFPVEIEGSSRTFIVNRGVSGGASVRVVYTEKYMYP